MPLRDGVKLAQRRDFPRYSGAFRFAGCEVFKRTNGDLAAANYT
jgi:hypothetical protein